MEENRSEQDRQRHDSESNESSWRLSYILKGHSSDVKCVRTSTVQDNVSPSNYIESVLSASRDETGRLWSRSCNIDSVDSASTSSTERLPSPSKSVGGFVERFSFRGNRYANSVALLDPCREAPQGLFILGSLDAITRVFLPSLNVQEHPKLIQEVDSHHDNISCIVTSQEPFDSSMCHFGGSKKAGGLPDPSTLSSSSSGPPVMITGSWDQTARVYHFLPEIEDDAQSRYKWKDKYLLKGHTSAVWSVAIVSRKREEFLTSSADCLVRLFKGQDLIRIFTGHQDVVRGITLLQASPSEAKSNADSEAKLPFRPLEPLFLTSSNDTTLQLHSLDENRLEQPDRAPGNGGGPVRTLKGSKSLVYESCWMSGLSLRDSRGQLIAATSGEDGCVRIWNCNDETLVETIPQPVISVWSISYFPISGDLVTGSSDGLIRVYTQRPRNRDGCSVNYSSQLGEVSEKELASHEEACRKIQQASNGLQSEIVAADSNSLNKCGARQLHSDGLEYDSILQIDVSDDSPPLELAINKGDHPKERAKQFIKENELPDSYLEEIVQFIEMVGPK